MAIFNQKKKTKEKKGSVVTGGVEQIAWKVFVGSHISEKATELVKKNRYIFKVTDDSNKGQIKKAIKELYGVDALSVNIINIPRKEKRLGKYKGWKKAFKKAIIEVKEGQRIDSIPK